MMLIIRSSRTLGVSIVLLAALTGCSADGGGSTSGSASSTPSASATKPAAESPSASSSKKTEAMITIKDFAFQPAGLTVPPGTKITVINKDSATHTVTVTGKNGSFDTGNIKGGKSATFTAPATAGSYSYDCTLHPFMKAELTVK